MGNTKSDINAHFTWTFAQLLEVPSKPKHSL